MRVLLRKKASENKHKNKLFELETMRVNSTVTLLNVLDLCGLPIPQAFFVQVSLQRCYGRSCEAMATAFGPACSDPALTSTVCIGSGMRPGLKKETERFREHVTSQEKTYLQTSSRE